MIRSVLLLAFMVVISVVARADHPTIGDLAGSYRLNVEGAVVEGDSERYTEETGRERGWRMRQHLELRGAGSLPGGWSYEGHYDDAQPGPDRLRLSVWKENAELFAGTARFHLSAPGLLAWERLLTGVQGKFNAPQVANLRLQAAIGRPLGLPMREQLIGRGLVGPYLLNGLYVPVAENSERVLVDGQLLIPEIDYEIDYELGAITFRDPIPESSLIEIEYEYKAPQARTTAAIALHWDSGPLGMDLLAGAERSHDPASIDHYASGMAVEWRPSPASRWIASWLLQADRALSHPAAGKDSLAWQLGGTWVQEQFEVGFDYRVIPPGFHLLGRTPDDLDRRSLSLGYQGFFDRWHSRLSLLWWQTPIAPQKQEESQQLHLQADHVLSYVFPRGVVGWSLSMHERWIYGEIQTGLMSGVLARGKLGSWELQAERRGLLIDKGPSLPDQLLATTNLRARLIGDSRLSADIQWKQDRRRDGGERPAFASVWRIKATGASGSSPAWWQVRWLQSTTVRKEEGENRPSRLLSARVDGWLPLGIPGLSTGASFELRRRLDYDTSVQEDIALQMTTTYGNDRTSMMLSVADRASLSRHNEWQTNELQRQTSRGVELVRLLRGPWAYHGALFIFGEEDMLGVQRGIHRMHGVSLTKGRWKSQVSFITGVLDQLFPEPSEDEDDEEGNSLRTAPVGYRLSWSCQYEVATIQALMRLARDWQAEATAWHGELTGKLSMESTRLELSLMHIVRRATTGMRQQQRAEISAHWQVGFRSQLRLGAHVDVMTSFEGDGDYRACGLESGWTAFF
ncbi:MAG: hypothetical protein GX162_12915 [Firmicutes bacterium]|jgi:hypothetical protein|nr:hypothetical protein [Bacillota bacterium]